MRFIVFGDSKGKDKGINKKVLNSLMKSICSLSPSPEFIVVCGDSVAGGEKEEILNNQLNDFKSIINKYHYNKPIIPVVGNHEVNIVPEDDRYEKVFSDFYSNTIPKENCLKNYHRTVYYIDFQYTRLIILNSFHHGQLHKVSKDQLNWLEEISINCNKNKLLFVHSPLFPTGAHLGHCLDLYPDDRDALLKTIEKCNIDIVFCGHEHNYSRRLICTNSNDNGIYQIISGGGGEKLRDKYKSKNNVIVAPIPVFHFLIIDINNDSIKVSAITSKGKEIDTFTIDKSNRL